MYLEGKGNRKTKEKMEMKKQEKRIIKENLDEVYKLLKNFPDHKTKGSNAYQITFLLENINMKLEIPFED